MMSDIAVKVAVELNFDISEPYTEKSPEVAIGSAACDTSSRSRLFDRNPTLRLTQRQKDSHLVWANLPA